MRIFTNAADVLDLPRPTNLFLLEPYIPRGCIILLYGYAGIGKTATAWTMAHAIQRGVPLWGLPVTRGNVLFIEVDTPTTGIQERWGQADIPFRPSFSLAVDYIGFDCLQFLSSYPDTRHREIKELFSQAHEERGFDLVIVDAIRKVINGDLSTSGIPDKVYDAFKAMFPGAAILFIHHERKMRTDPGGNYIDPKQNASGNMEFINMAQVALQFYRRGKETFLAHRKSQLTVEFADLPISLADDGIFVYNREEAKLQAVRRILAGTPPNLNMRDLDKLVAKELNISERSARSFRLGAQKHGEHEINTNTKMV